MQKFLTPLFWFALIACSREAVRAEPIGGGQVTFNAFAIQDITLLGGTTINPGAEDLILDDIRGFGVAGLNLEAQVGNTIEISSLFGWEFVGSDPQIGDYRFGNIPPFSGTDYSGEFTNVVQDANDPGFATGQFSSFESGDYSVSGDAFAFESLSGSLTGTVLTTDPSQGFTFVSTFDGLPPSPGTELTSAGQLNILLGNDVVGYSSDRRIIVTAIPEPSCAAFLMVGSLVVLRRRRS
jgi:hypothetical protein